MGGIPMRPDFCDIPVQVEQTIGETLMHVNGCQGETINILQESLSRLYGEGVNPTRPVRDVNCIREDISRVLDDAQMIEKLARELFRRL